MMLRARRLAVLGSLAVWCTFAWAQEAPPAAETKTPAPTKTPAEPKAESSEAAAKKDEPAAETNSATQAAKPTKDSAGTPQRFIPSEQVRSDFDVSFPVDI
jgi:hypothetical protein